MLRWWRHETWGNPVSVIILTWYASLICIILVFMTQGTEAITEHRTFILTVHFDSRWLKCTRNRLSAPYASVIFLLYKWRAPPLPSGRIPITTIPSTCFISSSTVRRDTMSSALERVIVDHSNNIHSRPHLRLGIFLKRAEAKKTLR